MKWLSQSDHSICISALLEVIYLCILPINIYIMSSRFLSLDCWQGRNPRQLSRELSNCFSFLRKFTSRSKLYLNPFSQTLRRVRPHVQFRATTENVSSQLYTFSCAQLKNCRLVLCCFHSNLSFRVLSRRSTDRHVARTRPKPCNISRCSPLNRLQNELWETAENNTTRKV